MNPRSLLGSDSLHFDKHCLCSISIHAPSWGATGFFQTQGYQRFISIHAPSWGATDGENVVIRTTKNFNPRSLVGSDPRQCLFCSGAGNFNPRSLVGSDHRALASNADAGIFQSTLPRGERLAMAFKLSTSPSLFQSTLPRGERQIFNSLCRRIGNFNPRSLVGSDWLHTKI